MRLKRIFEPLPILLAAAVGAVAIWLALKDTIDSTKALAIGGAVGAAVQIAVRLFGVS